MAGENKSDNKLFQLLMVVMTTIIAPVSVYFITHSFDSSAKTTVEPTSALSSPVEGVSITATLPAVATTAAPTAETAAVEATASFTPTVAATATTAFTATTPPQPTAAPATATPALPGVQNPQGILPAGDPAVVNNFAVSVAPKEVQMKDGYASVKIHVRNLTGQKQTFSYKVQSIAIQDAGNHTLEVAEGDKRSACSRKELGTERKIDLAPNQEIVLHSIEPSKEMNWCKDDSKLSLPLYRFADKEAPKSLVIQFDGFGPFKGFGFKIEY